MFDRWDDRSRNVMRLAREEADRLHHDYLGTEHILLGLVAHGASVAARALASAGIDLASVRERVERVVPPHPRSTRFEQIPFTPRAKRVLELAVEESVTLGHSSIGTAHVLLGLVTEGEGVGARVILDRGVTVEQLRAAILALLSDRGTEDGEPGS